MKFECSKCGACCRRAGWYPDFSEPLVPGTKICSHLKSDNTCAIYENRPRICRIDFMARHSGMDQITYFEINNQACNEFQEVDGMDEKYRIEPPYRKKRALTILTGAAILFLLSRSKKPG